MLNIVQIMGKLDRLITVRKSPLHGVGVFAMKKIEKNCIVSHYDGECIDWEVALQRPDKSYMRSISFGYSVIDGLRKRQRGRGMGSLVNHSRTPNATFHVRDDAVFIKTLQSVERNDEITVNYGSTFWRRHARLSST